MSWQLPCFLMARMRWPLNFIMKVSILILVSTKLSGLMAMLYARKGQYDKAISIWQKELKLFDNEIRKIPAFYLGIAGQCLEWLAVRDEALTLLHELIRRANEEGYMTTSYMAFIYIGLGEDQKALELLEKGFNDKDWFWYGLKCIACSIHYDQMNDLKN